MKEYVNFLTEKGLLVYDFKEGHAQMFKTSERGLRFLQTYNRLNEMIKEDGQTRPSLQSQVWMQKKGEEDADSVRVFIISIDSVVVIIDLSKKPFVVPKTAAINLSVSSERSLGQRMQ